MTDIVNALVIPVDASPLEKLAVAGDKAAASMDNVAKRAEFLERAQRQAAESDKRAAEASAAYTQSAVAKAIAQNSSTESTGKAEQAAEKYVESLARQVEALGKTKIEVMALEAAKHKLTDAQALSVAESLKAIDAHQKQETALAALSAGMLKAGFAVAALAGGFAYKVGASINAAAALSTLSEKTGIATEQLVGLKYAADVSDTSIEAVARSLSKLPRAILEAQGNSNSEAGRGFAFLGINPADIKSKEEAISLMADAIKRVEDPMAKQAALQMILKRSGDELIPFFNQGADGLAKLEAEGQKWNRTSSEGAMSAKEFKDQIVTLELMFGELSRSVGAFVVGPMVKFLDQLIQMRNQGFSNANSIGAMVENAILGSGNPWGDLKRAEEQIASINALREKIKNSTGVEKFMAQVNSDIQNRITPLDFQLQKATENLALARIQIEHIEKATGNTNATGTDSRAIKGMPDARERGGGGGGDPDSTYRNLIKTLTQKLDVDKQLTEVEKLQLQLDAMSAKQRESFTPSRLEEVKAMAALLDVKKLEQEISKSELAASKLIAAEERKNEKLIQAEADAILRKQKNLSKLIEDVQFETSIVGLNTDARKRAVDARKLEAMLEGMSDEGKGYYRDRMRLALEDNQIAEASDKALKEHNKAVKEAAEADVAVWRNAAKDMQRGMSSFFFDVLEGNVSTLGQSFKKMINRMIADYYAAQVQLALFGPNFSKANGALGGIAGGIAGLFGFGGSEPKNAGGGIEGLGSEAGDAFSILNSLETAAGGNEWTVGGSGGTDSKLANFRVSPGELITVRTPQQVASGSGGAQNVRVEIANEGNPKQVQSATPRVDVEGMIIRVVMADQSKNGPITQGIANTFNLRR